MGVGNFPALERPGPSRRGICFIKASEAMKASYFFASFLTSFLFLFSLGGEVSFGGGYRRLCARTSSGHQQTCTRDRSVWRGRCRRHQQECRSTSLVGERLGVCKVNQTTVHPRLRSWSSLDGPRKTLVPLGVVVFQTDLEFDGLNEVATFFRRGGKEFLDGAPDT